MKSTKSGWVVIIKEDIMLVLQPRFLASVQIKLCMFNHFTTGHFRAKVPGTPAVSKVGIFVHKIAEVYFQTKLAQMADNQFLPKYGTLT